jgi:hypothetical protein
MLLSSDSAFSMLARPSVTFGPKYDVKLIAPTRDDPSCLTSGSSTLFRMLKMGSPDTWRVLSSVTARAILSERSPS